MAVKRFLLACLAAVVLFGGYVQYRAMQQAAAAQESHPALGQMLQVGDVQIHAYVAGQGPDLILLHGAGGNLRDFTFDLVGRLKDGYRVIAFDRPGLGYSDSLTNNTAAQSPMVRNAPRRQANVLHAAAQRLGVTSAIVMGQSYGGTVALAWALEHPESVNSLVLVSTPSFPWQGNLDGWYRVMNTGIGRQLVAPLVSAFGNPDKADRVLAGVFKPNPVPIGYQDYIGVGLALRRETLIENASQVNGLKHEVTEMQSQYATLMHPTELIHGTRDDIVPLGVHSQRLVNALPNASLTTLPDVGHMPHHTAPEDIIAAIHRASARAGLN